MRAMAAAAIAGLMLGVAACGGNSVAQPSGSIKVSMTEFAFAPSTISAPAGKVVFYLVNAGNGVSHDLVIRDTNGNRIGGSELVSSGDSVVFTVDSIQAGTYTYFCDQPGHEESGMKGTLTVT